MLEIALDFDGTLADTHKPSIREYNAVHGTDVSLEDIKDWKFGGVNIDIDEYLEISSIIWHIDREVGGVIDPLDDLPASPVAKLAGFPEVEVDVVTARSKHDHKPMKKWLDRYHISDYIRDFIHDENKADLGYDIYIDDNPEMVDEVDIQYLPSRPWTESMRERGIVMPSLEIIAITIIHNHVE